MVFIDILYERLGDHANSENTPKERLGWFMKKHQNLEIKDLKNYKNPNDLKVKIEPEEFQFDNGIICGETGMAFMDESSDEEN